MLAGTGPVPALLRARRLPCPGRAPPSPARLLEASDAVAGQVVEAGVLAEELQLHGAGRAVTLLADDDLGQALVRRVLVVVLVAVDEHDDVGVLLDGAGFAQVR